MLVYFHFLRLLNFMIGSRLFNTGIINSSLEKNKDGVEMVFAVNHLGQFWHILYISCLLKFNKFILTFRPFFID